MSMYLHTPALEVGSWWRVDTASGSDTATTVYAHDGTDAIPTSLGVSGSTVRGNTRDGTALFWSATATLYCKELTYQGVPTGTVVTSTGAVPAAPGATPPADIASIAVTVAALPTTYASPRGAWSSVTAYTVNQVVTYTESTYRALASSTNVAPGTDAAKWELWGGGGALVEAGTWVTATHYAIGNVVSDAANGQRYACVSSHTSSGAFATDLAGGKWTTTGPSKGYVDTVTAAGAPDASTSAKGIVQLAGDLAGTATAPTVAKVSGVAVTGTPTAGQVPTATGGTAATWQDQDHLGLTPTAVKTGNYTAAAGDLVPVDTTSGNVTVTFPTAPADRTVVAVKHVQGGTNTVTLALGGSDKFNTTTGTTTRTLTILSQALLAQYKSSTAVWYVIADDLPLSGLDSRYDASGAAAAVSATRSAANGLASLDSSTLVPTAQMGTGSASSTTVLQGDRTWATAVTLAQSGQTPSQSPVASGTAASVGSLAYAARADHVHASFGLLSMFGTGANGAATFDGSGAVTNASRSGSTYTAVADMHFTSATFSNGVTLNMDGYRLFVRGAITCPSGTATITVTPLAPSGTNNSAQSSLTTTATYGAGNGRGRPLGPAVKGATGVTGGGAGPGTFGSLQAVLSPVTGSSGNGGSGVSGAGGTGGSHGQGNWDVSAMRLAPFAFMGLTWSFDTPNTWNSGQNGLGPVHGGRGGASGAGDGTNAGGCGGCGGNVLLVSAMSISGGVSLTAPGGAGGIPTTGNCGGGGGGTGGVTILNILDSTGWTGTNTAPAGAHGTGVGSGGNGTDGAAGIVQTTTWL